MKLILLMLFLCLGVAALAQTGDSLIQLKTAAEAGDPAAQTQMGQRDLAHAEMWYRKAAAQGFARAQGKLGNLLLLRARMGISLKPEAKAAIAQEALKWMGLAASQGDHQGQSDLADVCLEGKWVKQDLIAAYQWSELACRGVSYEPYAIMASSFRDAAILKMTADQLAEGKRRVAEFKPQVAAKSAMPAPAWAESIKLTGISGGSNQLIANIGNQTFSAGESGTVKAAGKRVAIKCLEITATNATISIEGVEGPQTLTLK
jgi:hypothetical protein